MAGFRNLRVSDTTRPEQLRGFTLKPKPISSSIRRPRAFLQAQ